MSVPTVNMTSWCLSTSPFGRKKKTLKCIKISISSRCETDEIVRYALLFPFAVGVGLNISPSLVGEKYIKAFFSVRQKRGCKSNFCGDLNALCSQKQPAYVDLH